MYVEAGQACGLPNSETPMTQAAIDAQDTFIASVGSAFEQGNAALNDLIETLGGNVPTADEQGRAGVPTTGTLDTSLPGIPVIPSTIPTASQIPTIGNPSSWAWAPSPAPPIILPGGGAGFRAPQGESGFSRRRRYTNRVPASAGAAGPSGTCPVIVPLVTAIPIPPASSIQPPATPASARTTNTPPTPATSPLTDCRTGNICLDIMNGCVLPGQVSPEQLQACAQAGYSGNRNLYPAIAAAGGAEGGAFFGTPDPNPTPYTGSGMSGFGQSPAQQSNSALFGGIFESIMTAVATAAAIGILWKGRKIG